MSHAATNPSVTGVDPAAAHAGHHHHNPHLAHHFDTPEQQYQSGKLGMWVFLATEILMFGGLFCAYAVYRHNHPDVFAFAHKALDPYWGGVNTVVLITSSLTMAWAVRAAQLNQKRLLTILLAVTLLGGLGFMAIKTVEYKAKWEHHLLPGKYNVFSRAYEGTEKPPIDLSHSSAEGSHGLHDESSTAASHDTQRAAVNPAAHGGSPAPVQHAAPAESNTNRAARLKIADANAGTPDEAKVKPNFAGPSGLVHAGEGGRSHGHVILTDLNQIDQDRIATFFSVYFLMTGLHGVHVIIGMGLIYWILRRSLQPNARRFADTVLLAGTGAFLIYVGAIGPISSLLWTGVALTVLGVGGAAMTFGASRVVTGEGEFSPAYFAPVDLVGLYWHLVDLIWIFLFPLLYLIH